MNLPDETVRWTIARTPHPSPLPFGRGEGEPPLVCRRTACHQRFINILSLTAVVLLTGPKPACAQVWIQTSAPSNNWTAVASSADGAKLAAAVLDGSIYTLQVTPAPLLNLVGSGGNVLLSWTVPSLDFVLQHNSEFNLTTWTDVPAVPTLNLTNLQYQVSVSPTNGRRFYRLKQ